MFAERKICVRNGDKYTTLLFQIKTWIYKMNTSKHQ